MRGAPPARRGTPWLLLLAILLAAPAHARWAHDGVWEPSTPQDQGWMFEDADTGATGRRIYFNAIAVTSAQAFGYAVGTNLGLRANPNAPMGSQVAPPGTLDLVALLGAWKDCNGDGHVGIAHLGLMEYRVELLPRPSPCGDEAPFVRNGWVWEFLWITPHAVSANAYPERWIHDPDVAAWGDYGKPGAIPEGRCASFPPPKGTLSSTGGILAYADCSLDFFVSTTLGVASPDLAFDDPRHPERDCDHPLQVDLDLWGQPRTCPLDPAPPLGEDTGQPAFTVWDCGSPPDSTTGYPQARPALDPTGSYRDGAADLEDGLLHQCQGQPEDSYAASALGLDPRRFLESSRPQPVTETEGKRRTDFPMRFENTSHWRFLGLGSPLGDWTMDGGTTALQRLNGLGWRSFGTLHTAPAYMGNTVRGLEAAGPLWITAYARVGPVTQATATLPASTPGVYGAEACQGARTGMLRGWDCHADHWWRPDLGGSDVPDGTTGEVPGAAYHLRDVDCLDGAVVKGGPRVGLTDLAGEPPCPMDGS